MKSKTKSVKIPSWALEPLNDFEDEINYLVRNVRITKGGLNTVTGLPSLADRMDTIERLIRPNEKELQKMKRPPEELVEHSRHEISNGFPFINGLWVISIYAYMEAAIKNFVINFMKNNPYLDIKEFGKLKVVLSEYDPLREEEKYGYLFKLYEQSVSMGINYGTDRFESLLTPLGFGGKVKPGTKKTISELAQTRNLLLHKAGKIDHFFIQKCPWLNLEYGRKIQVSEDMYKRFNKAVNELFCSYIDRLSNYFGKHTSNKK